VKKRLGTSKLLAIFTLVASNMIVPVTSVSAGLIVETLIVLAVITFPTRLSVDSPPVVAVMVVIV
jgi:hypothetical protein